MVATSASDPDVKTRPSGATEAELASSATEQSPSWISVFSAGARQCEADGAARGSVRATAALPGPAGGVGGAPFGRLGRGPGAAGPGGGDPADLLSVSVRGAGACCYALMYPW